MSKRSYGLTVILQTIHSELMCKYTLFPNGLFVMIFFYSSALNSLTNLFIKNVQKYGKE